MLVRQAHIIRIGRSTPLSSTRAPLYPGTIVLEYRIVTTLLLTATTCHDAGRARAVAWFIAPEGQATRRAA